MRAKTFRPIQFRSLVASSQPQAGGAQGGQSTKAAPTSKRRKDERVGMVVAKKYLLKEHLASGGMGDVYLAQHVQLEEDNLRAIKLVKSELLKERNTRKRFLREVKMTHKLSQHNPHIVRIHDDFGFEDGQGYYVMEFLRGETLRERMQREGGVLPLDWSVKLMRQLCDALKTIHEAGIVHRDLKPENIFLTKDEHGEVFVKVMDFGVAKADNSDATNAGSLLGTPYYMSPEQIMAEPDVDGRSDLYALGVIFFELLTGRRPFDSNSLLDLCRQKLAQKAPSPRKFRPELHRTFESLNLRLLAQHPKGRFPSAAALSTALAQLPTTAEEEDATLALPGWADLQALSWDTLAPETLVPDQKRKPQQAVGFEHPAFVPLETPPACEDLQAIQHKSIPQRVDPQATHGVHTLAAPDLAEHTSALSPAFVAYHEEEEDLDVRVMEDLEVLAQKAIAANPAQRSLILSALRTPQAQPLWRRWRNTLTKLFGSPFLARSHC